MRISKDYKKLNEQLHADNKHYGESGGRWASTVLELAYHYNTRDILDYGAGKGKLGDNLPFQIQEYDPCIGDLVAEPKPADIVVCTDVLEHIEPECLDNVLYDLWRLTKKTAFLTISCSPAKKELPDGRNAHLIQEPVQWWLVKLEPYFKMGKIVGYEQKEKPSRTASDIAYWGKPHNEVHKVSKRK